jgi:hypothetical protein
MIKLQYTVTYFKPIKAEDGEVVGMQTHNRSCDTLAEARAFEDGLKAAGYEHTNILTPAAPSITERPAGYHLDLAREHAKTKWDDPSPVEPKSINGDLEGLKELGYVDSAGARTGKRYETAVPGLNSDPNVRGKDKGPRKRRKSPANAPAK